MKAMTVYRQWASMIRTVYSETCIEQPRLSSNKGAQYSEMNSPIQPQVSEPHFNIQ